MPSWPSLDVRRVAVGAGVLALLLVALATIQSPYARSFAWMAALLASFAGWGSVVNRWLTTSARADLGLRLAWGLCLVTALGGLLILTKLASKTSVFVHTGLGAALWLVDFSASRSPARRSATARVPWAYLVVLAVALLLLSLQAALWTGCSLFNQSDDQPLNFTFPQKILQASSLFDPFNPRRVTTYGGWPYVHAQWIAVAPIYTLHAPDAALSLVIVFALICGAFTRIGSARQLMLPFALAMMLLFCMQNVRVNTGSLVSGVAVFLAIYRTLTWHAKAGSGDKAWPIGRRLLAVLALCAVCVIAFRPSNAIPVCLFLGLYFVFTYGSAVHAPWRLAELRGFLSVGGVFSLWFVLFMLPWMWLMNDSVGTPLFPLGKSNLTPGFVFLQTPASLLEGLRLVVNNFHHDKPLIAFPLFALAGIAPLAMGWRDVSARALAALTLGSLGGMLAIIYSGAAFDAVAISRYYYAYAVATALAVAIGVKATPSGRVRGLRDVVVVVAIGLQFIGSREDLRKYYGFLIDHAADAAHAEPAWSNLTAQYRILQEHVPAGAPMAVAVDEPFRFDFARNQILSLDIPGGMGPAPGFPLKQGPEKLAEYFAAHGVRYLAVVDFTRSVELYDKNRWRNHLNFTGSYLQGEARVCVDALDSIEKLVRSRKVLHERHHMSVIDLGARAEK